MTCGIREIADGSTQNTLPSPPYCYGSVQAFLFESGQDETAVLLGRFRRTPVGDFDERWDLLRICDWTYRINRILVNNDSRCRAGRVFWSMPKHFVPTLTVDGGWREKFCGDQITIRLAGQPTKPKQYFTSLKFWSDTDIFCHLAFAEGGILAPGICEEASDSKGGMVLCLNSAAVLSAPSFAQNHYNKPLSAASV